MVRVKLDPALRPPLLANRFEIVMVSVPVAEELIDVVKVGLSPELATDDTESIIEPGLVAPRELYSHLGKVMITSELAERAVPIFKVTVSAAYTPTVGFADVNDPSDVGKVIGE